MALIKCNECGREISDKAQTCIGCGAPVTDSHKDSLNERDSLFVQAAEIVVQTQQGSASLLQRRLKLGYNRAGRIIDQLETAKIIGPFEGEAREVLVPNQFSLENLLNDTHSNAQTDFCKDSGGIATSNGSTESENSNLLKTANAAHKTSGNVTSSKPKSNLTITIVFVIFISILGFYFFGNSNSNDNNNSSVTSSPPIETPPKIESKPVINYHQLSKEDLEKTEKELIAKYKTQWDSIKLTHFEGIPQFKIYYEEVGKIITELADFKKEYKKEFPKLVKLHTTLIGSKKFNQALEDYFKFGQPYSHTYLTGPCESALEKLVKDPSSLDIISSEVQGRNKNGWVILIKYRSKNSFGAIVPGGTQFVVNYSEGSDTYDVTNVVNNY